MDYFDYMSGLTMTNRRFEQLFSRPPRPPESDISPQDMDLAASIQVVTEEIMLKMACYARTVTGMRHLCLAGGVALNCVANGKILREGIFDDIWIQPAAGDAGGALGAALYVWHHVLGNAVDRERTDDLMSGAMLGPRFSPESIRAFLDMNGLPYREMAPDDRDRYVARCIADEKVVGMCQERMEFGPRALGHRSILADARSSKMQSHLNLATKFRESFRPFAPIVLEEDAAEFFEVVQKSPYMLLVDQVRPERCKLAAKQNDRLPLKDWVNEVRSDVPAITHVDYSARIQTVDPVRHPRTHRILRYFKELTGMGIAVNTSFNVRSEPIVATPEDAYKCFMRTGIDVLVLDDFVLEKKDQPPWQETSDWREEFGLD
jgi:carbamoyltransferase